MSKFPSSYYADMVANKYFANVDRKSMDAVLDTFTSDAVFTIQSAFTTHAGRDTGIRQMFANLFENYSRILHKDFVHVADLERNAVASQFNVELVDPAGKLTTLSNCNFFYLDGAGKFQRIFVYMSGPNVLV